MEDIIPKRKRKRKRREARGSGCVAGGPNQTLCPIKSSSPEVSIHIFPKDEKIRKKWVRFVQRHRPNWQPFSLTSTYEELCSLHFEPTCYIRRRDINVGANIFKRQLLHRDAVPTIDTGQQSKLIDNSARARRTVIRELLKPESLRLQLKPIPPVTPSHQQEVDLACPVNLSEVLEEVKIKKEPIDEDDISVTSFGNSEDPDSHDVVCGTEAVNITSPVDDTDERHLTPASKSAENCVVSLAISDCDKDILQSSEDAGNGDMGNFPLLNEMEDCSHEMESFSKDKTSSLQTGDITVNEEAPVVHVERTVNSFPEVNKTCSSLNTQEIFLSLDERQENVNQNSHPENTYDDNPELEVGSLSIQMSSEILYSDQSTQTLFPTSRCFCGEKTMVDSSRYQRKSAICKKLKSSLNFFTDQPCENCVALKEELLSLQKKLLEKAKVLKGEKRKVLYLKRVTKQLRKEISINKKNSQSNKRINRGKR